MVHNLASERRAGGVALIDNDLLIAFKSQAGVPTSAPAPHLGNLNLILHLKKSSCTPSFHLGARRKGVVIAIGMMI